MGKNAPPLTNFYIEKNFGIPCLSVKEYEDLAKNFKEPKKCILNLNWEKGTHWVGCKTDKNNIIKYYDPFGVNSPFKNIKRVIIFNNIQDQELNESNCGWRVLFWLLK